MTAFEQFANNVASTLSAAITSTGATSLTVTSATGFPAAGNFRILIDSELLLVTAVSGTTFTVTRGIEGTTAATHLNGAVVTQILTAGSLPHAGELNWIPGTRPIGPAKLVKQENQTIAASGNLDLLSYSGGPGYLTRMWFSAASTDFMGREQSVLRVYIDGSGTPSISSTAVGFHCADYIPNNDFNTRFVGCQPRTAGYTYWSNFTIPFTTGVRVNLLNGSSSASTTVFSDLHYVTLPGAFNWGRMQRLCTSELTQSSIAPNSTVTLLDVAGRGLFFGLYQLFDDTNANNRNFHFAEGNHQIFIDGEMSPSLEWSGTEDYYENGGYWQSGALVGPYSGTTHKDTGVNAHVGAYRFHWPDPIPFESHLTVKWNCGNTSEASMTDNLAFMRSHAWYYLDQ